MNRGPPGGDVGGGREGYVVVSGRVEAEAAARDVLLAASPLPPSVPPPSPPPQPVSSVISASPGPSPSGLLTVLRLDYHPPHPTPITGCIIGPVIHRRGRGVCYEAWFGLKAPEGNGVAAGGV